MPTRTGTLSSPVRHVAALLIAVAAVTVTTVWPSRSRATGVTITVDGITLVTAPPGVVQSGGGQPRGAWRGPAQSVSGPFPVSNPHGGTVYYWYVKGLAGARSADPNVVIVPDNWVLDPTYDRASHTKVYTAANGDSYRRAGTPVYGVVAYFAPDVITQAGAAGIPQAIARFTDASGTLQEFQVGFSQWKANSITVDWSGTSVSVTAQPLAGQAASPQLWGPQPGIPNPSVFNETELDRRNFIITAPGYRQDLVQTLFSAPPVAGALTPEDLTVLSGETGTKRMRVGYGGGAASGTLENSYSLMSHTIVPSLPPVVGPPGGPLRVARFAIIYVPGDIEYLPESGDAGGK